jgi:excisionase family DNA binding protein
MQLPISQFGHNGGPPLDDLMALTVKTATRVSGFSKDTLYDLLAAKEIKGFLMGSRRYIEGASLRAYIARRAAEPLSIRRAPKPRKHRKPPEARVPQPENGGAAEAASAKRLKSSSSTPVELPKDTIATA